MNIVRIPKGKWSMKHESCIACGTKSRDGRNAHYNKGRCKRCHFKWYRKLPEQIARERERGRKYRDKIYADPAKHENLKQRIRARYRRDERNEAQYQKRKLRQKFDKHIQNWFNKKYIQKRNRGLIFNFEFDQYPDVKMQTPFQEKFKPESVEYFRKRLLNYLDARQ